MSRIKAVLKTARWHQSIEFHFHPLLRAGTIYYRNMFFAQAAIFMRSVHYRDSENQYNYYNLARRRRGSKITGVSDALSAAMNMVSTRRKQ